MYVLNVLAAAKGAAHRGRRGLLVDHRVTELLTAVHALWLRAADEDDQRLHVNGRRERRLVGHDDGRGRVAGCGGVAESYMYCHRSALSRTECLLCLARTYSRTQAVACH